ncbi:ATP-binding protein [Candidatus Cloacimonadota bacterium]
MKIAIASGKGGTGKTTVATNLASLLAERQQVSLTDLDVEEPNSGLFISGDLILQEDKFKKIPQWEKDVCIFCGNCQKVCNFNAIMKLDKLVMVFPELCHSCYACSELCPVKALPMQPRKIGQLKHYRKGKLDFVEGKLLIGEEQAVPLIEQTIEYTDVTFPENSIKLFDAPPGTSCPVIAATNKADLILLVTEPTPFGLHDLKLAVETMKELKKPFGIIINRYGIGDNKVEEYCADKNITLVAKIPNKRQIAELYSSGKLIYKQFPSVKLELEKIIDFINQQQKEISA